jgi:predicted AlkP superfamily phosphohydrolase/phosphomutase
LAKKALLLGIDGLSSDFLQAPLVADNSPNLTAFLKRCSAGSLWSTVPAYTAPAWTSITTGVDPGRHGLFGFTDNEGRPASDAQVGALRIWDYVGAAGGRSIVLNVPMTHPPRPIEGVLVSGMPSPSTSHFTYPSSMARRLDEFGYILDVSVAEGAREPSSTLARLAAMTRARGRTAAWLASAMDWDLFAIVFVLPDRLGHPWWKQLVPGTTHYETRKAARAREAARASVVALDDAVGELLGAVPADTAVVLCSDHGFGPLNADLFFDVALAEAGLMAKPGHGPVHRFVARAGRSKVARLTPRGLQRRVRDRAAGSGAGGAKAWTGLPYEGGVRLADPGDESLREQVSALLLRQRSPAGDQVVKKVIRREECYQGPYVGDAPDLLCEMSDESIGLHNGLHASTPWVSRSKLPWGTHASEGVVAVSTAAGAAVEGRARDITPTVLALLGLEVEDLEGRSLIRPEPDATRVSADHEQAAQRRSEENAYTPEQEAAVLEQLKGLGYVD